MNNILLLQQLFRSGTLLWDLSAATISPSSFIRIAIAVVFPPGAAHMSSIRSPFWGSKTKKNAAQILIYNAYVKSFIVDKILKSIIIWLEKCSMRGGKESNEILYITTVIHSKGQS